jgi:hypothetical protein
LIIVEKIVLPLRSRPRKPPRMFRTFSSNLALEEDKRTLERALKNSSVESIHPHPISVFRFSLH